MQSNKKLDESKAGDNAVIMIIIGVVIWLIILLNKKLTFNIPLFGKEDPFKITWKVYINRNWIWETIASIFLIGGIIRLIVVIQTIKYKSKK